MNFDPQDRSRSSPSVRLNSPYMISYYSIIVTRGLSLTVCQVLRNNKCLAKISRGIRLHRVHIVSATGMSINPRDGTYLEITFMKYDGYWRRTF